MILEFPNPREETRTAFPRQSVRRRILIFLKILARIGLTRSINQCNIRSSAGSNAVVSSRYFPLVPIFTKTNEYTLGLRFVLLRKSDETFPLGLV